MKICNYVIIKYVADEVRNEPINIGIIIREKNTGRFHKKFYQDLEQILIREPNANTELIREFINSMNKLDVLDEKSLNEMVNNFVHQIQFSDVMGTECDNIEDQLETLYKRFMSLNDTKINK